MPGLMVDAVSHLPDVVQTQSGGAVASLRLGRHGRLLATDPARRLAPRWPTLVISGEKSMPVLREAGRSGSRKSYPARALRTLPGQTHMWRGVLAPVLKEFFAP